MIWILMAALFVGVVCLSGYACAKVGGDADNRTIEHDEHEGDLPL